MSADFGCSNFKEISTKESVDEVAEVFESALRSGWLFREDGYDPQLVLEIDWGLLIGNLMILINV